MCYESIEVIYISFDIGEVADYRKEPNRRGMPVVVEARGSGDECENTSSNRRGMPVVVEARGSGDEWENTSQHHE